MSNIETQIDKKGITSFCFSPDKKQIAVGIKDSFHIQIYEIQGLQQAGQYHLVETLKEHCQSISTLDWSCEGNILSGSYDRQVIVWKPVVQDNKIRYIQAQCHMHGNKYAILSGEWTQNGQKFAVGLGGKNVRVGHKFNGKEYDTKQIKNLQSSALSVSFNPTGNVLAIGSSDQNLYIVNCFIPDVDQDSNDIFSAQNSSKFGTVIQTFNLNSWVEGVNWSQDGLKLAAVNHNSIVKVYEFQNDKEFKEDMIRWDDLSFTKVRFVQNDKIVCGGYQQKPVIFQKDQNNKYTQKLCLQNETSKLKAQVSISNVGSIASKFENNKSRSSVNNNELNMHKTPIIEMKNYEDNIISTGDTHGNIYFWKIE